VTLQAAWTNVGRWVTVVCEGTLSGKQLELACHNPPGGNPFGFQPSWLKLTLSADGNHLDGTTGSGSEVHESHWTRRPPVTERQEGASRFHENSEFNSEFS